MKLALTMMDQAWKNKDENINRVAELAGKARDVEADFIILPEMTLTGFSMETQEIAEIAEISESMLRFSEIAKNNDIGLIAGLVLESKGKYYNCSVAFDSSGENIGYYEKAHPFSFAGESRHISPGRGYSVFEVEGVRFGMSVCYDLRFPVYMQTLADNCDCIINIANWPAPRSGHWRILLQARSIENQVYVVGVNRVGGDGNQLEYAESSYAFSPDGMAMEPGESFESMFVVELDKELVLEAQRTFPVRDDRRPALYENFFNLN
ncbi:nitrilase-related carbon-nitrogen hydrolase [Pseudomonadota bacterium]